MQRGDAGPGLISRNHTIAIRIERAVDRVVHKASGASTVRSAMHTLHNCAAVPELPMPIHGTWAKTTHRAACNSGKGDGTNSQYAKDAKSDY
jgi:hypothetical protein